MHDDFVQRFRRFTLAHEVRSMSETSLDRLYRTIWARTRDNRAKNEVTTAAAAADNRILDERARQANIASQSSNNGRHREAAPTID